MKQRENSESSNSSDDDPIVDEVLKRDRNNRKKDRHRDEDDNSNLSDDNDGTSIAKTKPKKSSMVAAIFRAKKDPYVLSRNNQVCSHYMKQLRLKNHLRS